MKNRLFAYFDFDKTKAYPVVMGATYTETFNEEINSFNIVLDNVSENDRLYFDRPYHFCKIVNRFELSLDDLKEQGVIYYLDIDDLDTLPEGTISFTISRNNNPVNKPILTSNIGEKIYRIFNYDNEEYVLEGLITEVKRRTEDNERLIIVIYNVLNCHKIDKNGIKFNDKNNIIMLVDTFVENINTIGTNEKIYRYEIQLMNCVKLLEKIQCPNLMITHDLNTGVNFSIYDYIDNYMKLYSPKVKYSNDGINWHYEYLLKWEHLDNDSRFKVSAADMQMNEPTLREVITSLMSQVACIPTIDYRTLGCLDFRATQNPITISDSDGINFIKHSGASDSYASDLLSSPTQTLDSKNEVISDIVGFRDSGNAIIQQTKNLQLEVRYPIYKIKEVRMRTTDNKTAYFDVLNQVNSPGYSWYPVLLSRKNQTEAYRTGYNITFSLVDGYWQMKANFIYDATNISTNRSVHKGKFNFKIHLMKLENNVYTEILSVGGARFSDDGWDFDLGDSSDNTIINLPTQNKGYIIYSRMLPGPGSPDYIVEENSEAILNIIDPYIPLIVINNYNYQYIYDTAFSNSEITDNITHVWVEMKFIDAASGKTINQFIPMSQIKKYGNYFYVDTPTSILSDNLNLPYATLYPTGTYMPQPMIVPANIGTYINITDCVVESNKRRLLEVDYKQMKTVIDEPTSDLSDLAKYIYGTMGYTIGDTKITGFSDTYSRAQWWWSVEKSYFDTILGFINTRKQELQKFDWPEFNRVMETQYNQYKNDCGYFNTSFTAEEVLKISLEGSDWSESYNKMKFLFYITYQPLNNFKFKATKQGKEFPFAIEQLNNSADGLSDFERVTKNLQDVTNRIGNPVKSLPQTTDDINKLKALNTIYNDGHYDFTIFHRQFAIYEDYLSVNYTASENYVIKNYFTSIITKYRAYQYVDYNAAIVRKENLKIHCLLSDKHYYDGDDKLIFNKSETYSYASLANILGVSVDDIGQYISKVPLSGEPEAEKKKEYFKNVEFRYGYNNAGGSSPSPQSSSQCYYMSSFCSLYNIDSDYYDVEYKPIPIWESYMPVDNLIYQTNILRWKTGFDEPYFFVADVMKQTLDSFKVQLKTFINNNFSNVLENVLSSGVFYSIQKLNGSMLYDRVEDKYYIIQIKDYEEENPGQYSREEVSPEETGYETINQIFEYVVGEVDRLRDRENSIFYFPYRKLFGIYLHIRKLSIVLVETEDYQQYEEKEEQLKSLFLSGLTSYDPNYFYNPHYVIKSSVNDNGEFEETKNECSLLISDNGFAVYYQDYDNVSAGPQMKSLDIYRNNVEQTSPLFNDYINSLGGYLQKWQMWKQETYNEAHQVFFTYQISLKQPEGTSTIDTYISQLPVINKGWEYQQYSLFQIVDDNRSDNFNYTFYKDYAEILNQTVQFEYYTDKDIIIGRNFILHNRILDNISQRYIQYSIEDIFVMFNITNETFELKEDIYDSDENNYTPTIGQWQGFQHGGGSRDFNEPPFKVDYDNSLDKPYIEIDWDAINSQNEQLPLEYNVNQIKIALVSRMSHFNPEDPTADYRFTYYNYGCRDIIAFKRENRTGKVKYYLTFNDTKTNDVWYFANENDLFEIRECDNTIQRKIKSI